MTARHFEQLSCEPPDSWNRTNDHRALVARCTLGGVDVRDVGSLGNLTIDSGHEMYVPAMLAEGKVL